MAQDIVEIYIQFLIFVWRAQVKQLVGNESQSANNTWGIKVPTEHQ